KELAHLLFRFAEKQGWTKDALSFNNVVTSWPDVLDAAKRAADARPLATQAVIDFEPEED
ncbi:DUF1156 domain-containing protein, partial [Aeromicrobium phragmitis]